MAVCHRMKKMTNATLCNEQIKLGVLIDHTITIETEKLILVLIWWSWLHDGCVHGCRLQPSAKDKFMTKYYCDYCEVYLAHDSQSARRQHSRGKKHQECVRAYYLTFLRTHKQIGDPKRRLFAEIPLVDGVPVVPGAIPMDRTAASSLPSSHADGATGLANILPGAVPLIMPTHMTSLRPNVTPLTDQSQLILAMDAPHSAQPPPPPTAPLPPAIANIIIPISVMPPMRPPQPTRIVAPVIRPITLSAPLPPPPPPSTTLAPPPPLPRPPPISGDATAADAYDTSNRGPRINPDRMKTLGLNM